MSIGKELLRKARNNCVAVIGDGAITGGMAYEAMNCANYLNSRLCVALSRPSGPRLELSGPRGRS